MVALLEAPSCKRAFRSLVDTCSWAFGRSVRKATAPSDNRTNTFPLVFPLTSSDCATRSSEILVLAAVSLIPRRFLLVDSKGENDCRCGRDRCYVLTELLLLTI